MLLRITTVLLCLAMVAVMSACDTEGDPPVDLGDFQINFTGFDPHIGQNFYLKVKESSTGDTVGAAIPFEVTEGNFEVNLANIIQAGTVYNVDFWADVDGNGTPDLSPTGTPAGVDHTWRVTQTGTAAGLDIVFPHDMVWTNITPF